MLLGVPAVVLMFAPACTQQVPEDPEYVSAIETWKTERDQGLRRADGWLTVVGLHWLKEGENVFGSDPGCAVPLPPGKAPDHAGTIEVKEDGVYLTVTSPDDAVTVEGEPVQSIELVKDVEGEPTIVELGSLRFYIIERGEKLGVRVKDLESEHLRDFTGVESYPIDSSWQVEAWFEPYDPLKPLKVPNTIGQVNESDCPGAVVFDRNGKEYRLDVLDAGDSYWIIFADETNGGDTYGGGRFLYTDGLPDDDGALVVDFNKAYNPPCVFTPHATCPLPPSGNRLALAVEAGEKMYGEEPH
jgi:uncharacterized protein (DUF1684 family)